ncbi:MAG: hydroxylamine reductase, partial [Firmicutes bacterium]|nr:hydroxylamine reductase [Bacillota bacterium]
MSMFCNQCEQTAKGIACTTQGVCGKDPDTSALQDLLNYAVMGLSLYAVEARKKGYVSNEVNHFTVKSIFSTLTNVDFDPEHFATRIREAVQLRKQLKDKVKNVTFAHPAATFTPALDVAGMSEQGMQVSLDSDKDTDA